MAKGKKKKQAELDHSPRMVNRRAHHDYQISEKLEVGLVLRGTEVKSIRMGRVSLTEGFARVDPRTGELYLHNVQIEPYPHAAGIHQHEPKRSRKLLAHRREIQRLEAETTGKGVTLVPLALYFRSGRAKLEIGVGTGKKKHDKREDMKQRDAKRQMERAMTRKRIG